MSRSFCCLGGALCLSVVAAPARADEARWDPGEPTAARVRGQVGESGQRPSGDGVYGRFDGDLDLGAGLGIATMRDTGLGAARLSLHYFSMLGVSAAYADAFGRSDEVTRFASVGVDLRPLFIPRWSENAQQGPALIDLAIDSVSLGMGAFFAQPADGDFGSSRGFELSFGAGIPLAGSAAGPWLEARYLWRWGAPGSDSGADQAALAVVSWHAVFLSGLSD